MKRIFLFTLLTITLFTACKKDKDNKPAQTTLQKIQHKWNFISSIDYNYVGMTTNLSSIDTLAIGMPGEYIDFRIDNKVYSFITGTYDTASYSVLDDARISVDTDTLFISTLNDNAFTLIFSERINAPYYDNVLSLSK